jgi:hypothetical protein
MQLLVISSINNAVKKLFLDNLIGQLNLHVEHCMLYKPYALGPESQDIVTSNEKKTYTTYDCV